MIRVSTWRSIDVPPFGVVKGAGELPGMRQYQVLLDLEHTDAAARKPRLGAGGAARRAPQGQCSSTFASGTLTCQIVIGMMGMPVGDTDVLLGQNDSPIRTVQEV
jgi:hypothetical protein